MATDSGVVEHPANDGGLKTAVSVAGEALRPSGRSLQRRGHRRQRVKRVEREEGADEGPGPRYCVRHPRVETLLRCARCLRPYCVPCMVQSPIGYLCRDCAHLRRLPQYSLSYARVIPGAALLALGVGFLLSYVGFISWIGGMIVGVIVAAGLKRISGYKRGPEMEIIAAATVVLTVVSGMVFQLGRAYGPGHVGDAIRDALQPGTIGLNAIGVLVGVYIAIQQLR